MRLLRSADLRQLPDWIDEPRYSLPSLLAVRTHLTSSLSGRARLRWEQLKLVSSLDGIAAGGGHEDVGKEAGAGGKDGSGGGVPMVELRAWWRAELPSVLSELVDVGLVVVSSERVSLPPFAERLLLEHGQFSPPLATAKGRGRCLAEYIAAQKRASTCLLYTSPSPRDRQKSRMPSSA